MFYLIALFLILLDQISKIWILNHLVPYESVPVNSFFNLVLLHNRGISFSMLSSDHPSMPYILAFVALIICILIARQIKLENSRLNKWGYALILGGAIGNVIDRILYGSVVDFLDFYYDIYHWPAFNLADSFICVGAGLLILGFIKEKK